MLLAKPSLNMIAVAAFAAVLTVGCSTPGVVYESEAVDAELKKFNPPSEGMSGLYVYRDSLLGVLLRKTIYINNQPLAETGQDTFVYTEVTPGTHTISTESEFSNNDLVVDFIEGKHTYLRNYTKLGLFVGGANLEKIEEDEAQEAIMDLRAIKALNHSYSSSNANNENETDSDY